MNAVASKTQIDELGDRLRVGMPSATDLEMLDEYRESFQGAYRKVINVVRATTGLPASGRPGKSTSSIIGKLNRQTIRLSQMQDIAGCRLIVDDAEGQEVTRKRLLPHLAQLGRVEVDDRRRRPSSGYRAIHLIVTVDGHPVELQLRTLFQHMWSELSEATADRYGVQIKYGGNAPARPEVREILDTLSGGIADLENAAPDVEVAQAIKSLATAAALLIGAYVLGKEDK